MRILIAVALFCTKVNSAKRLRQWFSQSNSFMTIHRVVKIVNLTAIKMLNVVEVMLRQYFRVEIFVLLSISVNCFHIASLDIGFFFWWDFTISVIAYP